MLQGVNSDNVYLEKDLNENVTAEQVTIFESGNEMAAMLQHKSITISWVITQFHHLQKLLSTLME